MENKHASLENQVYTLLEEKAYHELTAEERLIVLEIMTEASYSVQHQLILNAKASFDDEEIPEPLPLILPLTNRVQPTGFMHRQVPIYQLFLTVAALILLFLVIYPFSTAQLDEIVRTEYVTKVDTVVVEKLTKDTIYQVEKQIVAVNDTVYVTTYHETKQEEPRLLEINSKAQLPTIAERALENKGNALKTDPTSVLIKNYLGTN